MPGFDVMGCGEARSKKEAQGKAAEMFCNLLAERGIVDPKMLPSSGTQPILNIMTPTEGKFPQDPPGPSHYPPPPPHQLQSVPPLHPGEGGGGAGG